MVIGRVTTKSCKRCLQTPASFPADAKRRRAIKRFAVNFVLDRGVLFRQTDEGIPQWITDDGQQKEILHPCHSHDMSGHLGRDKRGGRSVRGE